MNFESLKKVFRRAAENQVLPRLLFLYAMTAIVLAYGVFAGRFRIFPYHQLKAAMLTAWSIKEALFDSGDSGFLGFTDVPLSRLHESRIVSLNGAGSGRNILLTGGWDQFREYCPEHGCAAVILSRDGKLVHAYPFRPDEFVRHMIFERPHERWRVSDDLSRSEDIFGIAQMPDGGLVVTLESDNDFPTGEGLARLDSDGHVLWYHHSYASHWPYVDGTRILVTSGSGQRHDIVVNLTSREKLKLHCDSRYMNDRVRAFDFDGHELLNVSVLDAILNSNYESVLIQDNIDGTDTSACDLLHLNFVRPVGTELASHLPGVSPRDFLVSLRSVSAFAVIGARDRKLKYLYTGTFRQQHSVQPLTGSTVVLFDDHGITAGQFPSRVLTYDLANGAERNLFDSRSVPNGKFHPMFEGLVDVSPDRRYMLITSPADGEAYELRLSDMRVVTRIYNLQVVPSRGSAHDKSTLFGGLRTTHGVYYAQ